MTTKMRGTRISNRWRAGDMRSLGDFLRFLDTERPEEVVRVATPIDPKACDATAYHQYFAEHERYPWLVFENAAALDGSRWPGLFVTFTDTCLRRVALAYGLDPDAIQARDITEIHAAGMSSPEPPEVIPTSEAPVKEVVIRGSDLSLDFLPFFRNAERDSGPGWITPIYITRDFGTGRYNISWHRGQYIGPNRFTARFYPGRHIYENFNLFRQAGKPMPCAAVVGHHPVFGDAAATRFETGDEYEGANGIYRRATGSTLRVTPSELWGDDLLVPADAEIVLEGYMLDEYADAGPWSDYWRAYLGPRRMNIFEVSAITMRRKPIFVSVWPPTEVHANSSAVILNRLKAFFPGVRDVHTPFAQTAIVSYRPRIPGEAMHLAGTLLSLGAQIKTIIVIDDDLDPYDLESVFFSLATRMDARRDVVIMPLARNVNDPSCEGPTVGGLLIDATRPKDDLEFDIGLPPRERVEAAARSLPPDILRRIPSGNRHRL